MEATLRADLINEMVVTMKGILAEFLVELKTKDERDEVLSRKEACQFLGISLKTLSNYMDAGTLKAKKINGRVFLLKTDLMEVLSNSSR